MTSKSVDEIHKYSVVRNELIRTLRRDYIQKEFKL